MSMTNEEVQFKYEELCNTESDINQHLPILREYADKCESVVEMGVRGCVSLFAFLSSSSKKVTAIDILNVWTPEVDKLTFICADDLEIDIEPTDMLFIDTIHSYDQLIKELNKHAGNVVKYIAMHDTARTTFGVNGENGGQGLLYAIGEFLELNPEWENEYHAEYNNGMTIIKRK